MDQIDTAELKAPLRVTRQVMAWFSLASRRCSTGTVSGLSHGKPPRHALWLPLDGGTDSSRSPSITTTMKQFDPTLATGRSRSLTKPDPNQRSPIISPTRRTGSRPRPAFTLSHRRDFIVDGLPGYPHVVVASPCSGHGLRFAPVIGEILGDLVTRCEQGTRSAASLSSALLNGLWLSRPSRPAYLASGAKSLGVALAISGGVETISRMTFRPPRSNQPNLLLGPLGVGKKLAILPESLEGRDQAAIRSAGTRAAK